MRAKPGLQGRDLLIIVDYHNPEARNHVEKKITEKYGGCTRMNDDVLLFVGMLFDFRHPVKMDMPKYVEDAIC
jgi:hypothetical protein